MRLLEGVTVVTLEQAVAAPFATRQLADLGARIIKIERPDGGDFARAYDTSVKGLSSYFVWLNRTKESITLDLKQRDGKRVLDLLLQRADVFVQNLAPGAAGRLGTAPAILRARHPRLITCTVSGYGVDGPYADRKAYDLLVQSEAGLVSITGAPEAPARTGISVADIAAGMYAYSSILAALYARERSGMGAAIDVSLFDALVEWMGAPVYYTAYADAAPQRTGANHPSIAPYGPFRTASGDELFLAVQNAREWVRFCDQVLGWRSLAEDDRFNTNPKRVRNRVALHLAIDSIIGTLATGDVIARLDAAGVAHARMNSVAELLDHPQLAEGDRWREIGSPAGPLRVTVPPARISGTSPAMGDIPALGQQTHAILTEIGIDPATIEQMRKNKVV